MIDLETTCLASESPSTVEIIQLALVRITKDKRIQKVIEKQYYKPNLNIKKEASSVHGMTMQDLEKNNAFTAVDATNLTSIIRGSKAIVGHNVLFDLKALAS